MSEGRVSRNRNGTGEHEVGMEKIVSEFSSDDETGEVQLPPKTKKISSKSSGSVSQIVIEEFGTDPAALTDFGNLTDDELIDMLKAYGAEIGPILPTTRFLYEKKLAKLILGHDSATNGNESQADTISQDNGVAEKAQKNGEFSADDETAEEDDEDQPSLIIKKAETPPRRTSARFSQRNSPASLDVIDSKTSLRQRVLGNDRFSPSPKTIHSFTITEKSVEKTVKTPDGKVSRDFSYTKETSDSKQVVGRGSMVKRAVVPIVFLIILGAVLFYVYSIGGFSTLLGPIVGSTEQELKSSSLENEN